MSKRVCPDCGKELALQTPAGLCPHCLLRLAERAAPAAPPPSMPLSSEQPGERIGRYKLLEVIGEGGFGTVWLAEQHEPVRRKVALKIIKLGMDTKEVVARFEAERQALALMDHPSIARVFDGGATESGRPYFVMELVKGVRITEYCDARRLNTEARLKLFMEVCQAVQHAHQKGVIHRDLKPNNVLVTEQDGRAVPKVIDFGIAKATGPELTDQTFFTRFNQVIGTPAYMSPEQAGMGSLDVDTRSDIYALGVLLYELLTGRTPFANEELLKAGWDQVLKIIREQDPPKPSTRLSTLAKDDLLRVAQRRDAEPTRLSRLVRGELDWIVMKCLEKDRARRYETANGLASDLRRFLDQEPIIAAPPSAFYRFSKFARRNKTTVLTALGFAFVLLIGSVVSSWQAVVANKARNEATQARLTESQARLHAEEQRQVSERNLYAANMTLAQQAWEERNMGRMKQLLEKTREYPNRGFEWYYWQREAHRDLRTLRGHTGLVWSAAFSPDSKRIVTGSEDTTAKVWDALSGQEMLTLRGHTNSVLFAAFSPDGKRIVTASVDMTARVWDALTGSELLTLKGHSNRLVSASFSADGRRIVTGSYDGTTRVWDSESDRELLNLQNRSEPCSAWSPDGEKILTGITLWDASSGRQLLTLEGHADGTDMINSATFSSDAKLIVTGSWDGTAKVWDAASGKVLRTLNTLVTSACIASDGQLIATGHDDGATSLWDTMSGKELLVLRGHTARINSVQFSPDSKQIVTASFDHTAKVWSAARQQGFLSLIGHRMGMDLAAVSSDGHLLVTVESDSNQVAKVWELTSGQARLVLAGHYGFVSSVVFSPDSHLIATASSDGTCKVWNVADGREVQSFGAHSNYGISYALGFSPDGKFIVTGGSGRKAKVWDVNTGQELLNLTGHASNICSVCFSPDGKRIVTGSKDHTARVWDAIGGSLILTLAEHNDWVHCVGYSPDGRFIVTGSRDATAIVWDAVSGRKITTLNGHQYWVDTCAFSRNGKRIVTSSWDRTVRVWDPSTGSQVLVLKADTTKIKSVGFSSDGQKIVAALFEGAVRVWDAATPQEIAIWEK